jgi:hypothetical protein
MKSLIAALVLTTLFSTTAFARSPSPEKRLAHMSEELQLTAEQQQQVEAILAEGKVQHDVLAQQYSVDEEFHQQMRSVRQQSASEIEAVLNDEQREKFEAMRKQHQKDRSQHKG